MFKKFSLAQLFILQTSVNNTVDTLSAYVAKGEVPTDSTNPAVRAEALVKLGNDYAVAVELQTAIDTEIDSKIAHNKEKAAKKAEKNA